jgi:hypothetical protein
MVRLRYILGILALFALLTGSGNVASAQTPDAKFFPETGHWVTSDFWNFFQDASAPALVYGYPVTEAFRDIRTGLTVQYFQRARFEIHPENPDGQAVQLTPLGLLLYEPVDSPLDIKNNFACRSYYQTGFDVCFAFLDFFDQYGGVPQFGYPISGFELHNGRIVQWFERARLEWYPELPDGQKVRLANLGRIYFDSLPEDPQLLSSVTGDSILGSQVLALQPRVFVRKAVTHRGGDQQVFVVVQDQTLQPVYNAAITLTIDWGDGSQSRVALTTDRHGVAAAKLSFNGQNSGSLVIINADISYQGIITRTTSSFRIWQ